MCENILYENTDFSWQHRRETEPNPKSFFLHNHNDQYEILLFISGETAFMVEGTTYYPQKNDILITRTNEMHRMSIQGNAVYERIVINVYDSFFAKNDCEQFRNIFENRALGAGNLIHADRQLLNIFKRLEDYILLKENSSIVIKCALTELLYHINKSASKSRENTYYDEKIKKIIIYINENITNSLTLESIAEYFYMNKFYLCHIFKKYTGLTVNKYITYKRILLVKEFYANGMSLTEASFEAGFCSYSNFYKAYRAQTGSSPRKDLKKV